MDMTWEDYAECGLRKSLDGVVDEWLRDSIGSSEDQDENEEEGEDEDLNYEVQLRIQFDQVHQRKMRSGEVWD